MKKHTHPILNCRRRTVLGAYEIPDYGFTGIPRIQARIRYLTDNGAPEIMIAASRRQLEAAMGASLENGSLTAIQAADEASSCIDMGKPDAVSLSLYRRLLDLAGNRPKDEVEEADDRIERLLARLTQRLKSSSVESRPRLTNEVALLLACQARSTRVPDHQLDRIRQALNLSYDGNRQAWLAFLEVLLVALVRRGDFILTQPLREYIARQCAQETTGDPILNRKLWRFSGRG